MVVLAPVATVALAATEALAKLEAVLVLRTDRP